MIEQWRSGLGQEFDAINDDIDTLPVTLKGWESEKLFQLVKTAEEHLKHCKLKPRNTHSPPQDSDTNRRPGRERDQNSAIQASNFNKKVRQYIGALKFLTDTDPQQEAK